MELKRYNSKDRKVFLDQLRKNRDVRILTKILEESGSQGNYQRETALMCFGILFMVVLFLYLLGGNQAV